MKKIGVLTSGGDAPGMNSAIRSVVRRALFYNVEVLGIHRGYQGLIERDIEAFTSASVGGIIQRGGTILRTARSEAFRSPEGRKIAIDNLINLEIDGLIVIGGDGSLRGAELLFEESGIPSMTIPATIDNDMVVTDYTIGFDTALNNILDAINKIRDTSESHQRVAIIEVMGRSTGQLALMSALCCGALTALIPEIPWTIEGLCDRVREGQDLGKLYSIIIVAEGAGTGEKVGNEIERFTGIDVNITKLGYLQRGGSPSAEDNIMGTRFGAKAVEELIRGNANCLVGLKEGKVVVTSYGELKNMNREFDRELYDLTLSLSR